MRTEDADRECRQSMGSRNSVMLLLEKTQFILNHTAAEEWLVSPMPSPYHVIISEWLEYWLSCLCLLHTQVYIATHLPNFLSIYLTEILCQSFRVQADVDGGYFPVIGLSCLFLEKRGYLIQGFAQYIILFFKILFYYFPLTISCMHAKVCTYLLSLEKISGPITLSSLPFL